MGEIQIRKERENGKKRKTKGKQKQQETGNGEHCNGERKENERVRKH